MGEEAGSPTGQGTRPIAKYKLRLPKEWVVPFKAALREVCDVNICTTDMGCEPGELSLAITAPDTPLPQQSLDAWVEKAYLVTSAGMFRHRDGELFWGYPDYGGPPTPVRQGQVLGASTVEHACWVARGELPDR